MPEVPAVPLEPEVPELADVPLEPDEAEVPLEPDVPEEPSPPAEPDKFTVQKLYVPEPVNVVALNTNTPVFEL